jgi:hypothetical protein
MLPSGFIAIDHLSEAISLARKPDLNDSRTISRFRPACLRVSSQASSALSWCSLKIAAVHNGELDKQRVLTSKPSAKRRAA